MPPSLVAAQAILMEVTAGEVVVEYAFGVGAQVVHAHFVVRHVNDVQGFFECRGLLVVFDSFLCPVYGSNVGTMLVVVACNVDFGLGNGVDDEDHAGTGVRGVFGVRKACDKFVVDLKRIFGCQLVPF